MVDKLYHVDCPVFLSDENHLGTKVVLDLYLLEKGPHFWWKKLGKSG